MKKPAKAALLSALVFPGTGHFYVKKPVLGTLLAGCSLVSLYLVVDKSMQQAFKIVDKIQSGEVAPDMAAITDLLNSQATGFDSQLINISSWVLLICWVVGILDSYRIALKQQEAV